MPPAKPRSVQGDLSRLPTALEALVHERRWVVWRWEHQPQRNSWTKVPYEPGRSRARARSNDAATWGDHTGAVADVKAGHADGIGFMLHGSEFAAFDLDDCREPSTGAVAPWARDLMEAAQSYTEITVSGTGLRIIGRGTGPHIHRKQAINATGGTIETYRRATRYIVVTGLPLDALERPLENIDALIDYVVRDLDQGKRALKEPTEFHVLVDQPHTRLSLPPELDRLIREGVPEGDRSEQFHHVVGWLKDLGHTIDEVEHLLGQHPNGIARKYAGRLPAEVRRSYEKTGRDRRTLSDAPDAPAASAKPDATVLPLRWHGDADPNADRAWLVRDLIPETGKGLLSGQWGSAKTFGALDLSAAVMTGAPFAGRRVVRQGGVLFVAAEGAHEIPIRLRGITEGKLRDATPVVGSVAVDPDRLPIAWIEECPPLLSRDAVDILATTARLAASQLTAEFALPLALIIIDTVAAGAGFQDENAAAENQRVMAALEALSRRTGAFVLGVDHFGKTAETGTRGSSAKEAAADVVLAMLADRDIAGNVSNTRMAVRKLRSGATGAETPYELTVVRLGESAFGEPITTCVLSWQQGQSAPAGPKRDRWPNSLRVFEKALQSALAEHGRKVRPYGAEGPEVLAVAAPKVRAEFGAAYPVDSDTEGKQSEAKKKAFSRALRAALGRGLVVSRELGGVDHLWLPA